MHIGGGEEPSASYNMRVGKHCEMDTFSYKGNSKS